MSNIEALLERHTPWRLPVTALNRRSPGKRCPRDRRRTSDARSKVEYVRRPQPRGAVAENEKLRLQVAALENDGMELAARLGEAEEQIARLAASGGQ
jgi:hypothetical protein